MPASAARIAANRQNAERSTGPRTPEGKLASRRNGLKHGLAGAGIVLPDRDEAEVAERARELEAELRPGGPMGRILVRRMAVTSIRMEQAARHVQAATARRVRHAADDFDLDHAAGLDRLMDTLVDAPAANLRALDKSPEGVDRVIAALAGLLPHLGCWTADHAARLENLRGATPAEPVDPWVAGLSMAARGDFARLGPDDGAGLDPEARRRWAAAARWAR